MADDQSIKTVKIASENRYGYSIVNADAVPEGAALYGGETSAQADPPRKKRKYTRRVKHGDSGSDPGSGGLEQLRHSGPTGELLGDETA